MLPPTLTLYLRPSVRGGVTVSAALPSVVPVAATVRLSSPASLILRICLIKASALLSLSNTASFLQACLLVSSLMMVASTSSVCQSMLSPCVVAASSGMFHFTFVSTTARHLVVPRTMDLTIIPAPIYGGAISSSYTSIVTGLPSTVILSSLRPSISLAIPASSSATVQPSVPPVKVPPALSARALSA